MTICVLSLDDTVYPINHIPSTTMMLFYLFSFSFKLKFPGESDGRDMSELETLVWNPENPLTDKRIDNFMAIAR